MAAAWRCHPVSRHDTDHGCPATAQDACCDDCMCAGPIGSGARRARRRARRDVCARRDGDRASHGSRSPPSPARAPSPSATRPSAHHSQLNTAACAPRTRAAGTFPCRRTRVKWRSCYDNCSSVPALPRPRALRRSRLQCRTPRNGTAYAPRIRCARAPRSGSKVVTVTATRPSRRSRARPCR